jgi:hypothetical protein
MYKVWYLPDATALSVVKWLFGPTHLALPVACQCSCQLCMTGLLGLPVGANSIVKSKLRSRQVVKMRREISEEEIEWVMESAEGWSGAR